MKHTPGPWSILEQDDDLYITSEEGKQSICKLPPKYPKSEANAKLIAAAPILLNTLNQLLEESDMHPEKKFNLIYDAIQLTK